MDLVAAIGSSDGLRLRSLRVTLAATAAVTSTGMVAKPDAINYRSFGAQRGGLFCEEVFGHIQSCPCGLEPVADTRKRDLAAIRVCGSCGASAKLAADRRRRFGHVPLAVPVAHVWFRDGLAAACGIRRDALDQVLHCERWLITLDGTTQPRGSVLDEGEWVELTEQFGTEAATTGATAISRFIGGHRAILEAIPVLPPHLRPMELLGEGRLATSDLNDLYRRLINRNNRLRRLLELNAPEIILRNEARMLQEAVDSLFDNRRNPHIVTGPDRRALRSIADLAGGFRALGEGLADIDGAVASGEVTLERPKKHHRRLAALRALGFAIERL